MSNATPGDSTPPPAPLPPNVEPPTPDEGNGTSHTCPVDPSAVTTAARSFVDLLVHSGLLFPRCDGEECPDDGPDPALWGALSDLENALNPDRRPHDDPERVGRILAWAAAIPGRKFSAQTDAEAESATQDERLSCLLTALAIGLDTIFRSWELEELIGRETWCIEKPASWLPLLPRPMAEQMRVAVTTLETGGKVRWFADRPVPEPVTAATVGQAWRSADATLMAVHGILDQLRRQPEADLYGDGLLHLDYHQMVQAASRIPSKGWGPILPPGGFHAFGVSATCCHIAVFRLAETVRILFGNAAFQASREKWGNSPPGSPTPLAWLPEARPLLWQQLQQRGEFDLPYWLSQIESEAERFRFQAPPQVRDNSTGSSIIATSNSVVDQAPHFAPQASPLSVSPPPAAAKKETEVVGDLDWSLPLSRAEIHRRLGCGRNGVTDHLDDLKIKWEPVGERKIRLNLLDMTKTMRTQFSPC